LGAENHAFVIDVRKKGGGAAFFGVSKDVVNWHIRIVSISSLVEKRQVITKAHCEDRLACTVAMRSPEEYKYWLG
jgi:hypothetical protein